MDLTKYAKLYDPSVLHFLIRDPDLQYSVCQLLESGNSYYLCSVCFTTKSLDCIHD